MTPEPAIFRLRAPVATRSEDAVTVRRRDLLTAALCTAALSGCSAVDRLRGTQPPVPEAPSEARAAPLTPGTPAEIAARSTVPVLCYHQVREYTAADGAGARPLICPPAVLQRQLEAVLAAGMQPVTGEALVDHLQLGTPLADNAVLISFDDASGGQYTHALPILRRLNVPATFFVMTVVLDRPNWLSRGDVLALDAAGMTVASHTWDHHPVTRYGEKDWATQLAKPREQLEKIVGHTVDLFAYPYGLWNRAALPHVQAAGYRAAFQLTEQPQDIQMPLLTVRRVLTLPTWDASTLLARISPDHPAG
jgi:peptidoglycan/xylan/chitin deacetylase (PgdA/CDA1 family)